MRIEDGSGSGFSAKVDSSKRIHTDSVTFARAEQETELGNAYNINTGTINLTTANESGVLYVKNDEEFPLVIESLFYMWTDSTGGSGDYVITVCQNPTGGTLISNAVAADVAGVNRNFGSSNTLSTGTLVYKGAEGNTVTGGTDTIISIFNEAARREVLKVGDIVVPKGSSFAIKCDPPASNTNVNVMFAASIFIDTLQDLT